MKTSLLIFCLHALDCLLWIPAELFWMTAAARARLHTKLDNLKANL